MSHFEGSCPTCGQSSIESMITQSQRDSELAAEWQATAEAYRADATVAKDRVAELEADKAAVLDRVRSAREEVSACDRKHRIGRMQEAIDAHLVTATRLDAATALLERHMKPGGCQSLEEASQLYRDTNTYLGLDPRAGTPTPSERAAAERAVLEASAGEHDNGWAQRVWWAELARRAVSK